MDPKKDVINDPNSSLEQIATAYLKPDQASVPVVDKRRHFLAAFFLSFMFGIFGVDRFYLGKYWTGLLKLLTMGGFGVWALTDLSQIVSGSMLDKQGNKLIDAEKYKKFAKRTLGMFTLVSVILVSLFMMLVTYIATSFIENQNLMQLLQGMNNGDYSQILDQYQNINL